MKWVSEKEVKSLRTAARASRCSVRNELIILMLYRHGLRVSELCNLRVNQLDLELSKLHVARLKNGISFSHPISGDELRLIRRYLKIRKNKDFPYLFVSERGNQLSRFTVTKMIEACCKELDLRKITPHMLRHGCGYYLANKGYDTRVIQDYLGHKNIQNTVIYTRLSGKQFEGMWQ